MWNRQTFAFSLTELVFRKTGDYLRKVQSWRWHNRVDGGTRGQPCWKECLMPVCRVCLCEDGVLASGQASSTGQ